MSRKVLISEELATALSSRTVDGRRLSLEWGEPDADGFYAPVVTTTADDFSEDAALGVAWRRCEAANVFQPTYQFPMQIRLIGPFPRVGMPTTYQAELVDFDGRRSTEIGLGPTPTAALEALAAKLESLP